MGYIIFKKYEIQPKKTKPRFLIRGPTAQYSESSAGHKNGKLILPGRQEIRELKLVQMTPCPKQETPSPSQDSCFSLSNRHLILVQVGVVQIDHSRHNAVHTAVAVEMKY